MLFSVCVEHEYDWIMFIAIRLFICQRIIVVLFYMNKTFYGHTPNMNGLLNLDHSDTHNIDAKRCKVDNDSPTYLWHCRLGHIGVKRMKKLHSDGLVSLL